MGNRYEIMCVGCKEYLYLDSELTWWQDKELMYYLKDFLLSHCGHHLTIGGDEWNCARDSDGNQLPTNDYKKFDSSASKEDFGDSQNGDSGNLGGKDD